MTLAGCWAHVRHKSSNCPQVKARRSPPKPSSAWSRSGLSRKLFADKVRRSGPSCASNNPPRLSPSSFSLWEKQLPRLSGKSKLAEAIRYALSRRRQALERFLADGRIEINSNIVERAIRPQTIRKNSIFAGSDGGGRTWATIATLLTTAKMNAVDPFAWLAQVIPPAPCRRMARYQIGDLMPWNYKL